MAAVKVAKPEPLKPGVLPPTHVASPSVSLKRCLDALLEGAAAGDYLVRLDINLVIALTRFALAKGARTIGDLQEKA